MPPQNRSHVPLGSILGGKYRVTREIGRGGMAAVYEAENIDIGKRVAVKVLAAELITSRIVRERFIREARAAAAIRSPYICDVYDNGMYEERPFLVMELLEGESLYDLMTRVRRLDLQKTIRITTHTCRGLAKAHEANVIHRDLKPENIFLTKTEDGETVAKLLDFGLAKFYEPTGGDRAQARLTREGALFGTPAYMSPEQAKGQGEVDHRCDLWALGCIVYECLTGQTVWNVDQGVAMILAQIAGAPLPRPTRLRPDLPRSFDQWFFKALDRNANHRFQTAKEFGEALVESLVGVADVSTLSAVPGHLEDTPSVTEPIALEHDRRESESQPSSGRLSPQPRSAEISAEKQPSRLGKALAVLLLVAVGVLGGYGIWLYALHPPVSTPGPAVSQPPVPVGPEEGSGPIAPKPLEREPYALQVGSAQEWLANGNQGNAIKMFKEAFANGGTPVARALLAQISVQEELKVPGPCRLTGLGRPRPFDLSGGASRPSVAVSSAGPVLAWTDTHLTKTKRQGFAVVLDYALRRVSMTHGITPESEEAQWVQLLQAGDQLGLIYADTRGSQPGVYVRLLEPDGRIAGKARLISREISGHRPDPAIAQAPDGTFWATWEDHSGPQVRDLYARHLSRTLAPIGEIVQLTHLPAMKGVTVAADTPEIAFSKGWMHVVFTEINSQDHQIKLLSLRDNDPVLLGRPPQSSGGAIGREPGRGQDKAEHPEGASSAKPQQGPKLQVLSAPDGKNVQPRIKCVKDGCFVAWHDSRRTAGSYVAFVNGETGEKIWHREIAPGGGHATVAASRTGAAIVWFSQRRVYLASINRDGLGPETVLGQVTGYQPVPDLVPGLEPGEWYVAWRDYESGHLEAFLGRVKCP